MTAQPQSLGETDMLLSSHSQSTASPQSKVVQPPSDIKEGVTSFFGGISGLLFAFSLIFFLQAPLISGGILLTLISGWGGAAMYTSRKDAKSK